MANIDTLLQQILTAVYGEDVRGSIHDAIAAMNEESSEAISVSKTAQDSAKNSADAAAKSATDAADAVADLDNKHTSAVDAVTAAKTDALSAISVDRKSAEDAITAEKNTSLGEIDDKTAASVNALTNISNSTEAFKTLAQSYAEGGTGTRDGEDTANAKYYMEQAQKIALGNLDDKMSDTSENAVQNKVIKAYVDGKTPAIATTDTVGTVKPDGSTITVDEDGTIHGTPQAVVDDSTATLSTTYSSHKIENKTRTNLINPTLQTTTGKGVTCTANGDGTYTFNGTPTARINFFLLPLGQGYDMKSGVTYRLSGCPNGGGYTTYEIIAEAELGTTYIKQYAHEFGNGVSFTVPQADIDAGYKLRLTMSVRSKVTNLTFKPMLTTDLSATYDDFVQYSGNSELNANVAGLYKEIQNLKSVLQLKITFAEAFKGAQYTITGGSESYSGTVPDSLQVVQKVEAYNTTYTISSTANGTKYSTTAATGQYAGEYATVLNTFTATINVTVTAAGAKVSGATATATLNGKTYTATTNSSGVAAVKVYSAGTYAISATYRDYAETSGSSVAISTNEQIASGSVAIFGATLTVDADISGRTSSATNTITVTDGTHKQTATITANGSKVFTIYYAGTYTVSMTNGTDTSTSVSVDCKTDGGTPSASISYFKATLTVKVINGNGATVTATDGAGHTYTGTATSGSVAMTVYAAGTYTVSAELSGETGVLTASVTVDTNGGSYTANVGFPSTTLNDNDWDVISAVSAAGLGDTLWDVGDCKAVEVSGTVGTLSLNDTYYAFIIGFNHNSTVEGEGITFQGFKTAATGGTDIALCDGYYNQSQSNGAKYFQMNHWGNTNYGGWAACDMRYDILGSTDQAPSGYGSQKATGATGTDPSGTCATNPKANTLMAALPAALRAVMKPITKVTDGVGNSSNAEANLRTTKDYLPLLAEFEIFGARAHANTYEQNHQKQYDYYKNGNPKIKYNHSATTTAVTWWERSASFSDDADFCMVNAHGYANDDIASRSHGLALAFLI